jgi:hypothetical protein
MTYNIKDFKDLVTLIENTELTAKETQTIIYSTIGSMLEVGDNKAKMLSDLKAFWILWGNMPLSKRPIFI